MEINGDAHLERRTSQASNREYRLGNGRSRSRKQSLVTPNSAKSLVSFPSLSPDNSPGPTNGSFLTSPGAQTGSVPHTPRTGSSQAPSIVQTLIQRSASSRGRTSLFEDSPKNTMKEVPGALNYVSDEHIQHLIAKTGAVAMVRQLAGDLAQRDAEMTAFRRRAEERERELKKMLREVEVSNLDIETRLHRIGNLVEKSTTGPKDLTIKTGRKSNGKFERAPSVPNGIDQMMGEAMKDGVGTDMELDEGYLDSLDVEDKDATIKAMDIVRDADRVSIASSVESQSKTASTVRGWKDYLWSAKDTSRNTSRTSSVVSDHKRGVDAALRSRASSGNNGRRKALDEDLFNPLERAQTTQSASNVDVQSRKSSSSVASWTMKLFAGNTQTGNSGALRGRSATTGSGAPEDTRAPSNASTKTTSSAKAALLRVNSLALDSRASKKGIPPVPPIPTTIRNPTTQAPAIQLPSSPKSVSSAANLGPVEMDTILPLESRPPTDQTYINNPSNILTDRYGFIYDQRRRKREAEMLRTGNSKGKRSSGVESLNGVRDADRMSTHSRTDSIHRPETPGSVDDRVEGKPSKRWQDYLKKATFPTELLSHTPSAKSNTTVVTAEPSSELKRSPTFSDVRGSLPSTSLNPEPAASPITASKAEISKPVANASDSLAEASSDAEPVKLLLAQLTELHDTLQHERTVKWNEFLRKVRAERRKEGETLSSTAPHATAMPEVTLTDGEMIGVAGLGNKGKVGRAKWKEFKQLVLAGIPVTYRAKIWAECTGASALRVPGYYDDLVKNGIDDPEIVSQIQMDINRTMTDNVFFRAGPGVAKLNEVLLAYSRRNPEIGYCQGMNLITASLLLIMPTAEDAFWLLTSIIENILPDGYYSNTLLASRADQLVLRHYVSTLLPKLSAHLDNLGIELEALTFQWFLSVFTACLSAEALFRVWDVVLCFNDGSTFLFQVGLALLKLNEQRLLAEETAGGVYNALGSVSDHEVGIDGLIRGSDALKGEVKREDVDDLRLAAVEEERKRMGGDGGGGQGGRNHGAPEGTVQSSGALEVQVPIPVEE